MDISECNTHAHTQSRTYIHEPSGLAPSPTLNHHNEKLTHKPNPNQRLGEVDKKGLTKYLCCFSLTGLSLIQLVCQACKTQAGR